MRDRELRSYWFETADQWQAGAFHLLAPEGTGMSAPRQIAAERLSGTGPEDATPAISINACGDLFWVRPHSFELMRLRDLGGYRLGRLGLGFSASGWHANELVVGAEFARLIGAADDGGEPPRLFSYLNDNLQRLAALRKPVVPVAIAGDRNDGMWILSTGDGTAELNHVDAERNVVAVVAVNAHITRGSIATSCDGRFVFVLDAEPVTGPCDPILAFRLWRFDRCDKNAEPVCLYELPKADCACFRDYPDFFPDRLVVDDHDRLYLLDRSSAELWKLSTDGVLLGRNTDIVPPRRERRCEPEDDPTPVPCRTAAKAPPLRVYGIAAGVHVYVSHPGGIARLTELAEADQLASDQIPAYVTPALHSPIGVNSGWLRADIDATFGANTALEVSVAATSDAAAIKRIRALFDGPGHSMSTRLDKINVELDKLPHQADPSLVFSGTSGDDGTPNRQRLRVPLDSIDETHLWVRIRFHTPRASVAPILQRMRVIYPNVSFTRYLPAMYRDSNIDAASVQLTQRLVGVFESVFGDLDLALEELPRNLDPSSAPAEWLPFLLRWLGFPAPTELGVDAQRALLRNAHALLSKRGTIAGLSLFLRIAVGSTYQIVDAGLAPGPWALPGRSARGARLGCNTLVLCQRQPGFRLGETAQLQAQPLGESPLDPVELFQRRSRSIVIRVAREHRPLRKLIERYLPYLIPAHCRYRLLFVAAESLDRTPRLGDDLRIYNPEPPRIGEDAELGRSRLPRSPRYGVTIGPSTFLDGDLYLS